MAFQDAGTLSGGEKTKLALAQLVAGRKNLLLLDEPTNNLDPPSRTAIAEALAGLARRHGDREPRHRVRRSACPERVLMMPDGTLDYWSDDLLDLVAPRVSRSMLRPLSTRGGTTGVSDTNGTADLVFVNGAVYTVDAARSWAGRLP